MTTDEKTKLAQAMWTAGVARRRYENRYACPLPYKDGSPRIIQDPWQDFRDIIDSNPWKWYKKVPTWAFLAWKDILGPQQETCATRVTARRPQVQITGVESPDALRSETLVELTGYLHERLGIDPIAYAAEKDAWVTSCSWLKVEHDPLSGNELNVRVDFIRPDDAVACPGATALSVMAGRLPWWGHRYLASVGELKEADWTEGVNWNEFTIANDKIGDWRAEDDQRQDDPTAQVMVYEFWFPDRPVEWVEEIKGTNVTKGSKSSVWRFAGGIMLNPTDKGQANPEKHDLIPVIPLLTNLDGTRLYHGSQAGKLIPLALEINRVKQLAIEFIMRAGGTTTIVNKQYCKQTIGNEIMRVIEVEPGPNMESVPINQILQVVPGPNLPRHLAQYPAQLTLEAQDVGMQHDQMQGKTGSSHITATASANSYESDLTFVERNARHMDWTMERLYNLIYAILKNHSDWSVSLKVEREETAQAPMPDGETSVLSSDIVKIDSKYLSEWDFTVAVESTSSLPEGMQARTQSIQMWTQMLTTVPEELWVPIFTYAKAPRWLISEIKAAAAKSAERRVAEAAAQSGQMAGQGGMQQGMPGQGGMGGMMDMEMPGQIPPGVSAPMDQMDPAMLELADLIDQLGLDPLVLADSLSQMANPPQGGMPIAPPV